MNKEYWDNYYINNKRFNASKFAFFLVENFPCNNKSILDLGCGDGCDSVLFYEYGMTVSAIDQSMAKDFVNLYHDKIEIVTSDFTTFGWCKKFDYIFARFIFHAIDTVEEQKLLPLLFKLLSGNGCLFIEFRSTNNELYAKRNAEKLTLFQDNHYRRFIESNKLINQLIGEGFSIDFFSEDRGFSPIKFDDQLFVRIIARKDID